MRHAFSIRSVAALWFVIALFVILGGSGVRAQVASRAGGDTTFHKDVLPILQRSCQICHRPGAIAPMSLMSFEETRPWARSIKRHVEAREMPPWYIDRRIGIQKFKDDPSLTDQEIATISAGVEGLYLILKIHTSLANKKRG